MLRIYEAGQLSPSDRRGLIQRFSAEEETTVGDVVAEILRRVEAEGAAAVQEYTRRFDGTELPQLTVPEEALDRAGNELDRDVRQAFEQAAENIRAFHELQMDNVRDSATTIQGSRLGFRYTPIEGAAVYAPGGTAVYPSSVLMGLIPASVAGVRSPLLITPPTRTGSPHPAILFCAQLAGCRTVLQAGGAQGIAAAAFGLAGPRAQLITGPGNRYVNAAKAQLAKRGLLKMDMPAGPSEVLVIADESANPEFVAADLLSQVEHGADSQAVLATTSRPLAEATARAIERGLAERTSRAEMKGAAIHQRSFAVVFKLLDDAIEFANEYAAEHLEICTADPERDFAKITSAGSVFLGHYAPVALGDYFSGTNHVLPTGGAARFYSGLGVDQFLKRISYQHPTRESLERALAPILAMSRIEGLADEHGHSVAVRFENPDGGD